MRRKLELKEITENATVLNDMLKQIEIDQRNNVSENVTEDTLATLKCLYDSCQKLQPTIMILLNDTEDNDCLGNLCHIYFTDICATYTVFSIDFVDDALEANDLVHSVSQNYHQLLVKNKPKNANACLISTSDASSMAGQNGSARNTMDELNEIFANNSGGSCSSTSNSNNNHSNIKPTLNAKLLEPTMASAPVNQNGSLLRHT